jgi:hypothetical protein
MQTFDDDVLAIGRDPFALLLALSPVALGVALVSSGWPGAAPLGAALAWLGLGIFSYVWTRNPTGWSRAVRLRVDADGVHIDGRLWSPLASVRSGVLEGTPSAPVVALKRGHAERLCVAVRDRAHACDLLAAAGVERRESSSGPTSRAAPGGTPSMSPSTEWALARPLTEPRAFAPAGLMLAAVLVFGRLFDAEMPGSLALAVLALVVFFVALAVPTRVLVGSDGVLLCWLGTARFVPWSRVAGVESVPGGGVTLALDRGEPVTLGLPAAHDRFDPEGEVAIERMRQAWRDAVALSAGNHALAERLSPRAYGGTRAWVLAARELTAQSFDYRAARVPDEQLWRIVESPRAERDARMGAAVALGRELDDGGRRRLRVAADGCVEPRLRSALDLIATDSAAVANDEALVQALDALEWEGSYETVGR